MPKGAVLIEYTDQSASELLRTCDSNAIVDFDPVTVIDNVLFESKEIFVCRSILSKCGAKGWQNTPPPSRTGNIYFVYISHSFSRPGAHVHKYLSRQGREFYGVPKRVILLLPILKEYTCGLS